MFRLFEIDLDSLPSRSPLSFERSRLSNIIILFYLLYREGNKKRKLREEGRKERGKGRKVYYWRSNLHQSVYVKLFFATTVKRHQLLLLELISSYKFHILLEIFLWKRIIKKKSHTNLFYWLSNPSYYY